MTVDRVALLRELQGELRPLIDDLRARCEAEPDVDAPLRDQWQDAVTAKRTARSYAVWRDDELVDVAVAWVLAGVFVRFCEDNGLIEAPLLGGSGTRLEVARGHRTVHFQQHPGDGRREWMLEVFTRASRLPGLAEVFGAHSPLWRLGPTDDGARRLLEFWERRGDGEVALHDFTDAALDTRFLGDLYQDLSDTAKKRYALLQTPVFVEEFILDRTLEPAIAEFGLDEVSIIDPTCGSGHFLLGAFDRLFPRLRERHAAEGAQVTAQRALDAIAGVDLNPAAAAIARFRMLVAALNATGTRRLADLPDFHVNVAVGDSLLHGRLPGQQLDIAGGDMAALYQHQYASEDVDDAKRILFRRYHAVVGNPPYITVKDAAMGQAYRNMFKSCHRQYSLGVPFFERFFDLAIAGDRSTPAGFVGMITANSFMKREFGKKLIEQFIPTWDLTHVIDSSGAYIPGHGTPTVLVFGRHQHPVSTTVRGVLGSRGEPSRPAEPPRGIVWTSITSLVDSPGAENDFVTVTDLDRATLARHPWSIGGGGASELKERLDSKAQGRFKDFVRVVGRLAHTSADESYFAPKHTLWRFGIPSDFLIAIVEGDTVRDWKIQEATESVFPYSAAMTADISSQTVMHRLWLTKQYLVRRREPNGTHEEIGLTWFEWSRFHPERLAIPLGIAFSFVATHNHFVLDRGGKVFNRSAPVIKMAEAATIDDHFSLLGLLNSAGACFWMQQVFHNKGGPGGGSSKDEKWHDFYEFDGTKVQQLPIPTGLLLSDYGQVIDAQASEHAARLPGAVAGRQVPSREALATARDSADAIRKRMIAAQEELDWYVMGLYGLLDDDFTYPLDEVPPLQLGERAFEIVMARQIEAGELETTWFTRHGSAPITEVPAHWPEAYRQLVERRIERIENDRDIALIERPERKRRWASEPWEAQQERALRGWLLDRLEAERLWADHRLKSARALAELVRSDADFVQVAQLYGGADVDLVQLVTTLASAEAVPYVAACRYTDSGMRKRAEWEATWALQRKEDAGVDVGTISMPPKYGKEDFNHAGYWPLRGKLDVPKERFISYPGAGRDNDPSPLLGWAGWNHLQRAQALATWFTDAVDRGAEQEKLVPLLAGLWELVALRVEGWGCLAGVPLG